MSSGVLGLDWGQKRIGIATADPLGISITPHPVFIRKPEPLQDSIWIASNAELLKIEEYINDYTIDTLILGSPVNLSGQETQGSLGSQSLKTLLEKKLPVQVHLINESLTSWEAEQESATWSKSKRKFFQENSDSFVAAKFVELFLASKK